MNKRIKKKLRKRFRLRTYSRYKEFKTNINKILTIKDDLLSSSARRLTFPTIKHEDTDSTVETETELRYPTWKEQKEWLLKELRRVHFSADRIYTSNQVLPGIKDSNYRYMRKARAQVYRVVKGQIYHGKFNIALRFLKRNGFPNVEDAFYAFASNKHEYTKIVWRKHASPVVMANTGSYINTLGELKKTDED